MVILRFKEDIERKKVTYVFHPIEKTLLLNKMSKLLTYSLFGITDRVIAQYTLYVTTENDKLFKLLEKYD